VPHLCHFFSTLLRIYKAIKLDFWTMPYEIPHVRFRNRDRTAVELRNLFLKDVREFIPEDGYYITCVCVNRGNPFLGRYADASRMSADIGEGTWPEVHRSAIGLTTAGPFYRHDCLLGDPDSIGWCPGNTPGENRLWATMSLLSGGLYEIGGDLTRLSDEARAFLRTVTRHFAPRRRTLNHVADGGVGNLPADHLVLEGDDGAYEAYLNWTDERRQVRLPCAARDLWTGRRISGETMIPPRDVVWFKRQTP